MNTGTENTIYLMCYTQLKTTTIPGKTCKRKVNEGMNTPSTNYEIQQYN